MNDEPGMLRSAAQSFASALPDWNVERPLDYGTNFTVRGPSRVLMSVD